MSQNCPPRQCILALSRRSMVLGGGATIVSRLKGTAAMNRVSGMLMLGLLAILLCMPSSGQAQVSWTSGVTTASSGWTFVQEALNSYCVPGNSSCSFNVGTLVPTTAGTVRVIFMRTANATNAPNVTITSVTGAGSTWNLCPASSCHIFGNDDLDMAYAIGGSGAQTSITVTLSGASGSSFFTVYLYEFLPPAGSTASFDTSGVVNHACSSGATTGVSLPITATDLILTGRGNGDPSSWNAYGAPYIQLISNNALSLNDSTGAAPTIGCTGSSMIFNAIAFKSSLGTFAPPTNHMKAVNYTNNNAAQINCSSSCSLTIPSTNAGDLLYLEAADINGAFISSVSGAGTWVVPTGANTCRNVMSGDALSCAYVLSTTAGVTSLNITMTGSGAVQFAAMEISPLGGTFSFDTQGSTINSASFNPSGQALTLGSNPDDVIFQTIFVPGGTTAVTHYPMPPSEKQGPMFFNNEAGFVALTDAATGVTPTWDNQQNNATLVTGVAFTLGSGSGTKPAPPTGLSAIVN